MDKIFAQKVLMGLEAKGNDMDKVKVALAGMDAKEQQDFLTLAGEKLGLKDMSPQQVSIGATIGRASAQGASLGFGDELSAAAELGFGKFMDWAKGTEVYKNATYKELRDVYRQENKAAKKSHPLIYGATEIATSLPALIGTAGQGSAAGLVSKTGVGALAKVGAVQGGAMALGGAEGGLANQLVQTAIGAGLGTVTGAAGGYVGKKLAGRAAEKAARVIDPVDEELASKISSEAAESMVDPAVIQKVTARPPVTPLDDALAKMGEKDVNVVAYARSRGGEKVLKQAPSLDSNVAGGVRNKFDEGMKIVDRKLKLYEKKAGGLIEKSGVSMGNEEIANIIQKQISIVEGSGKEFTKPGQAVISALEEKLSFFMNKKTGELIPGKLTGKQLRGYLQGLREENKAFFSKIQSGNDYSSVQEAIQNLSASIDDVLKTRVNGYKSVMKLYKKDLRAYMAVDKSMKRKVVSDFFTNEVKKPAQDILFGTRDVGEKWVQTLKDFGDAASTDIRGKATALQMDFLTMVKDRLAYAHLFPGKVTQAEMPSITQQIGQFAQAVQAVQGSPSATIAIAKKGTEAVSKAFKKWKFEKGLQQAVDKVPQSKINKILGTVGTGTGKFISHPATRSGMVNVESGAVNNLINEQQ